MSNTNKPVAWAWRFPNGALSNPYVKRSLCASLHIAFKGRPVPLVVQEEVVTPRQPLSDEQIELLAQDLVTAAVLAEREACAKLCEQIEDDHTEVNGYGCAAAIRCRNSGIDVPTRLPADESEGGTHD